MVAGSITKHYSQQNTKTKIREALNRKTKTKHDTKQNNKTLNNTNTHISDYNTLTLKFYLDKQFVTLHGEKSTTASPAQFNHLRRMYRTNAIAELFALQPEIPVYPQDDWLDIPRYMEPELAILIHTYKQVFVVPKGLPPNRSQNHAIPLMHGTGPVKVRPYRYPHSQKLHIEKMILDMLEEGLIVPSTSPFSSLIVLVKKKKVHGGFVQIIGL